MLLQATGTLLVLGHDGRVLRRFAPRERPLEAKLDAARLAVIDRVALSVFDLHSGRRLHRLALQLAGTGTPHLAGISGKVATYIAGAAVHLLDIKHGTDIVLAVPGIAPPVRAALTEAGLFYAYQEAHDRMPGRIAFVPRVELMRALAR